jgi:hypothetical protein
MSETLIEDPLIAESEHWHYCFRYFVIYLHDESKRDQKSTFDWLRNVFARFHQHQSEQREFQFECLYCQQ